LESAQLLMSPETAAEHATLRRQFAEAAATVADLVQKRTERLKVENALRDEVEVLRAQVAELEKERHSTNESLSEAAEALRVQRDRIAELEALKPAAIQTCRKCGAGYTHGEPCSVCEFQARMAAETGVSPQVAKLRGILAGQREAVEAGEGA
jgi:septal ring factor EnvC (AmiA/AmiB activator)